MLQVGHSFHGADFHMQVILLFMNLHFMRHPRYSNLSSVKAAMHLPRLNKDRIILNDVISNVFFSI